MVAFVCLLAVRPALSALAGRHTRMCLASQLLVIKRTGESGGGAVSAPPPAFHAAQKPECLNKPRAV